jgi:hypothetical protein
MKSLTLNQTTKELHMVKRTIAVALAATVVGCAGSPDKMQATYTSPSKYANYSCEQLSAESYDIKHRVATLYNSLKKEQTADAAQMAVGMVLFWPALLFLEGGDGPEAAEYSRLKGELEALESATARQCGS